MVYLCECSWALENNVCSVAAEWNVLHVTIRFCWYIALFSSMSLLIFSVVILLVDKRWVFPSISVVLSISPFSSIRFCFAYFYCRICCFLCSHLNCNVFLVIDLYNVLLSVFSYLLCSAVYILLDVSIATCAFFSLILS